MKMIIILSTDTTSVNLSILFKIFHKKFQELSAEPMITIPFYATRCHLGVNGQCINSFYLVLSGDRLLLGQSKFVQITFLFYLQNRNYDVGLIGLNLKMSMHYSELCKKKINLSFWLKVTCVFKAVQFQLHRNKCDALCKLLSSKNFLIAGMVVSLADLSIITNSITDS